MKNVNDLVCIIIDAGKFPDFKRETLFDDVVIDLLNTLESPMKMHFFGHAPDNTADGNDELLINGNQHRVIVPCDVSRVDYDALDYIETEEELRFRFIDVILKYKPTMTTLIIEKGETRTENTIEFLYMHPLELNDFPIGSEL